MVKKSRNILGIILLSVFLGQLFDSSLFSHKHSVDGVVVVHSHLYNLFEKHRHQHSDEEFAIIQRLSHAVFTAPVVFWPTAPTVEYFVLPEMRKIVFPDVSPVFHAFLRAPPFVGSH